MRFEWSLWLKRADSEHWYTIPYIGIGEVMKEFSDRVSIALIMQSTRPMRLVAACVRKGIQENDMIMVTYNETGVVE